MQYIPNFVEQNAPQIQSFLQSIAKGIAPDYYAQQTFKQLAEKDPSLVTEISNMDDPQREIFSKQVLGAKNKNPLANIGIGQVRKDREEKALALKNLTPDQQTDRQAGLAGVRPQSDITYNDKVQANNIARMPLENQALQNSVTGGTQNNEAGAIKLNELKAERKRIDDAVAANPNLDGIDIHKVAEGAVYGRGNHQLITALQQDPGSAELLTAAMRQKTNEIANQYQKDDIALRNSLLVNRPKKDLAKEDAALLSQSLNEAQQQYAKAESDAGNLLKNDYNLQLYMMLKPKDREKQPIPENLQKYQDLLNQKDSYQKDVNKFYTAKTNVVKALQGISDVPDKNPSTPSLTIDAPPTPLASAVEADIKSGKVSLKDALDYQSVLNDPQAVAYLKRKYGNSK